MHVSSSFYCVMLWIEFKKYASFPRPERSLVCVLVLSWERGAGEVLRNDFEDHSPLTFSLRQRQKGPDLVKRWQVTFMLQKKEEKSEHFGP